MSENETETETIRFKDPLQNNVDYGEHKIIYMNDGVCDELYKERTSFAAYIFLYFFLLFHALVYSIS